jgi:hypothetical protein
MKHPGTPGAPGRKDSEQGNFLEELTDDVIDWRSGCLSSKNGHVNLFVFEDLGLSISAGHRL